MSLPLASPMQYKFGTCIVIDVYVTMSHALEIFLLRRTTTACWYYTPNNSCLSNGNNVNIFRQKYLHIIDVLVLCIYIIEKKRVKGV